VLFADLAGSTKLYESAGDVTALAAIEQCIGRLRQATESEGGRTVKTIGDGVMALFPAPEAAAKAAVKMHVAIEVLPAIGEKKLALRIGLHSGPVIDRGDDLFGDTVNVASRLLGEAIRGQILLSEGSAALLGTVLHNWVRRLYSVQIKGKAEHIALFELVWRQSADLTALAGVDVVKRDPYPVLRLRYGNKKLVFHPRSDALIIGREAGCDLLIAEVKASRQHCTIERHQYDFVLKDHSTNGTYVTVEGDSEVLLRRQQFILRRRGWIAFGSSRDVATEIVEFLFEDAKGMAGGI
jgi:adenylate cyclase